MHQTAMATLQQHGAKIVENRFKNLPTLKKCLPASVLQNTQVNRPAIVVASGPSLSKNIGDLQTDFTIISCDSAYPVLRKNGINPDYVCSIDYSPETVVKYGGWGTDQTRLITMPGVATEVLQMPFADKYYFFNGFSYAKLFSGILGTIPPAIKIPIQSCAHLAIITAQLMGCSPIILVGHDYHMEQKSHADGVVLTWPDANASNAGLAIHKQTTEIIIQMDSGKEYINATQSGFTIKGTKDMKLSDALKIKTPEYDLAKAFDDISQFGENTMVNRSDAVLSLTDLEIATGSLKAAAVIARGWV